MEGAQEGPCFELEHRWVQQGKLRPRQVGSGNSASGTLETIGLWSVWFSRRELADHAQGQTVTSVLMCV